MRRAIHPNPARKEEAIKLFLTAGLLLSSTTQMRAQARPVATPARPAAAAAVVRKLVVSIPDRKLALVENGVVVKTYRVAVGRSLTPSPRGDYFIANRVLNPTYYRPGVVIPPGKNNPVGTRWMGLSVRGFGIHGTDEPRSIGRAASHGCIRMRNRDIEDLFARVRVGDVVELHGSADAETLALFHSLKPAQPVLSSLALATGGAH